MQARPSAIGNGEIPPAEQFCPFVSVSVLVRNWSSFRKLPDQSGLSVICLGIASLVFKAR
jgi:hypothetical protein